MAKWQKIPLKEAKQHKLYGIRGWLAALAIPIILQGLISFLIIYSVLSKKTEVAGMPLSELLSIDEPHITFVKLVVGYQILTTIIILFAFLTKTSGFRALFTWTNIAYFPYVFVAGYNNEFDGVMDILLQEFFPWILTCAIFVTYVQLSKRVRVTYERSIRSDEVREVLDESIWALAITEFDGDSRHPGLWAKSLAHANGDESVAKASYLKQRAIEVLQEQERKALKPGCFAPIIHTIVIFIIVAILLSLFAK